MPLLGFSNPITPQTVSDALRAGAELTIPVERIELERRGWRWIGRLPDHRMVLVADTADAAIRLHRQAELLRLLAGRVSFGLPQLHHEDAAQGVQLRSMVPGQQIDGGREPAFGALPQAQRLAAELGRALGELHNALSMAEATQVGFGHVQDLPDPEALRMRLHGALADVKEMATLERTLALYKAVTPTKADIVLTHGDVWGGNMAIDLATGALNGLFDFDDAGLADRHLDFRYIHSFGVDFAHRAIAAYADASGIALSEQRMGIYHALSAFAFLAEALESGQDQLICLRRNWVSGLCNGPIAALLHNTDLRPR